MIEGNVVICLATSAFVVVPSEARQERQRVLSNAKTKATIPAAPNRTSGGFKVNSVFVSSMKPFWFLEENAVHVHCFGL